MKEIKGVAKTIREVLNNQRYSIDYYQREFRWQEKQVDELIQDLAEQFLNSYSPEDSREMVQHYEHYFLGSIIFSRRGNEVFIVDGQQRLTTLTLLLILLHRRQGTRVPCTLDVSWYVMSQNNLQTTLSISPMNYTGSYSFDIDWGDGSAIETTASTSPVHQYNDGDNYLVRVTISDDTSCEDYYETSISVPCTLDVYWYVMSQNYLQTNLSISPTNYTGSYSFDIDWGDGSGIETTTNTSPSHNYASSGSYLVRVTISDDTMCTDYYETYVYPYS